MSEDVWIKCEICGKGFDSYNALIAHLYEHILKRNAKKKREGI